MRKGLQRQKGQSKSNRTEEGENKDHTRVFVKTHTGMIAKGLAKVGDTLHGNHNGAKNKAETDSGYPLHRETEEGENKAMTGGHEAKDLTVKPAKDPTGPPPRSSLRPSPRSTPRTTTR